MAIFHLNYLNQVQIAANTSSRNRAKSIIQRFPKIIGDIAIADDCVIGANSVVKSITEKGITVAGVPAKKVSSNNSAPYIDSRLDH